VTALYGPNGLSRSARWFLPTDQNKGFRSSANHFAEKAADWPPFYLRILSGKHRTVLHKLTGSKIQPVLLTGMKNLFYFA
jgi:hypothetical protein